jgi:CheY-like chemotaxis protein
VVLSSTGSALIEDKHNLYSGYLTKPVKTEKLFQMIQKVVAPEAASDATDEIVRGNFADAIPNGASLKILIAEDNPINLAVASKTLELLGYSSEKAVNGYQVLEKLSHTDYDLILMDVQMPDLNGLEATKKIKNMYINRQSPVIIALTASYQDKDRKACLSSGMDDVIAKPINPEKLDEVIKHWFPEAD